MAWRKIEDGKLTAIADATREMLGSTVTMNPDAVPGLIRSIGIGYIPNYWRSYLEDKATEINAALNAAGSNRSAFLWYTDAHWTTNYKQSPMLLKYLSKNTGMAKTFFGGDVSNEKTGETDVLTAWQRMVGDIPAHHSVLGNHDNQLTDLSTPEARSDFFIAPERTGDMVFGVDATYGKTHYYIDNHIEKTRYICLNTGVMWTPKADTAFCVDALVGTPNGWHIVVISHLWLNYNSSDKSIITTPPDYTKHLLDLFDAYNYRESGTTSSNSVAYNFAEAGGKVEFVIGGHVHRDYDFVTAKGIPVILTECDAWEERDDVSVATKGTTTESCVYAIVADYTSKQVKIINVGRGDTRSIAIPDVNIIKYTNQLPIATDSTGAIYNGIGYKPNTRISVSSGNFEDKTADGWYTTGFIKATAGDVIRLKNCSFASTHSGSGTNRSYIYGADANYAFISGKQSENTGIGATGGAWSPVVENGNIVQFTLPSYMNGTYIRITLHGLSAESIITVNEEID